MDCQAFARHLGQEQEVLDEYGGTDIYQLTPAQIEVTAGANNIRCLRLTSSGLYRWYANCCNTPIGNTMRSRVAFVGLIHSFISKEENRDAKLGPVLGCVYTKSAKTPVPTHLKGSRSRLSLTIRIFAKLLSWKIKGGAKLNPFFEADGKLISDPTVMNERA
jgi:hypothetical protein